MLLGKSLFLRGAVTFGEKIVSESVIRIFADNVFQIIHRDVVAAHLHIVIFNEIHAQLHLVGKGLEFDRDQLLVHG